MKLKKIKLLLNDEDLRLKALTNLKVCFALSCCSFHFLPFRICSKSLWSQSLASQSGQSRRSERKTAQRVGGNGAATQHVVGGFRRATSCRSGQKSRQCIVQRQRRGQQEKEEEEKETPQESEAGGELPLRCYSFVVVQASTAPSSPVSKLRRGTRAEDRLPLGASSSTDDDDDDDSDNDNIDKSRARHRPVATPYEPLVEEEETADDQPVVVVVEKEEPATPKEQPKKRKKKKASFYCTCSLTFWMLQHTAPAVSSSRRNISHHDELLTAIGHPVFADPDHSPEHSHEIRVEKDRGRGDIESGQGSGDTDATV